MSDRCFYGRAEKRRNGKNPERMKQQRAQRISLADKRRRFSLADVLSIHIEPHVCKNAMHLDGTHSNLSHRLMSRRSPSFELALQFCTHNYGHCHCALSAAQCMCFQLFYTIYAQFSLVWLARCFAVDAAVCVLCSNASQICAKQIESRTKWQSCVKAISLTNPK